MPATPRKFLVTLGLSDEQLILIGNIAAQWSVIEWMLMRTMESLLPTGPKEARVLAIGMGAVERIRVVRLLAELRLSDGPAKDELLEILSHVDTARSARNDIAHGLWAVDKDEGGLHLMKYRGGRDDINRIKGDPKPVTTQDLQRIDQDIRNTLGELLTWRDRHRDQVEIHTDD